MSISSKMDKYIVLYSYNRTHNNENECSLTTPINIEGSHKHNVEWEKKKKRHKRVHVVSFHLYNTQKEVQLKYTARKLVNLFKDNDWKGA